MLEVVLTADEIHLGASHAILRRHQKHRGDRGDRAENQKSSWDNEINGALAELAWCKLSEIYWTGVGGIRASDGGSVEIRWTHHEGKGGLIVYDRDDDGTRYVLAEGYPPQIRFVGWAFGRRAKAEAKKRGKILILGREMLKPFKK